ncbi:MAG: alanine--tRNA ligase [Negativicutes bacterium]|nr:alanine--tRNA ligase [Negativicutes bacterium]
MQATISALAVENKVTVLTGNEIRQSFLDFFAGKGHLIQPSASLIPEDDPTLLLIGAGMAPLKPYFTGKLVPANRRMASCQKCIRTGDIDNVGRTARHHTFFEMLGNFSFGDYFKREAIAWGWEYVTGVLKLPPGRLWVSVHTDDDEAAGLWQEVVGIPAGRIVRLADNFWEIGPGPCGPCSEIYVDQGEEFGCDNPACGVGCDCDRYLEIWNLVFTQYDRDEAGNYTPLAQKNIDTGAGLERIAAVMQGKRSNYETDLVFPIIKCTQDIAGYAYGRDGRRDVSFNVIADHLRSVVFMVGDGVLPANEGRGYVLRRLLRRAVRHGRLLGIERPFLVELAGVVVEMFGGHYPNLAEKQSYIANIISMEEERFNRTLAQGLDLLKDEVDRLAAAGLTVMPGETVFRLYDTFGFPWELTGEVLKESGLGFDSGRFEECMEEQRQRARAARDESGEFAVVPDLAGLAGRTVEYRPEAKESQVLEVFRGSEIVGQVAAGDGPVAVVLAASPFYPEGGGQVGDSGWLEADSLRFRVDTSRRLPDGTPFVIGEVVEGYLTPGLSVQTLADRARNAAIARNHSATHLLHAALRKVLGGHVNQAGSLVDEDRLRFDFSHFQALTADQLKRVEDLVNAKIWASLPTTISCMGQAEARQRGAMALFGEKYGDRVRVVSVGDFSRELCGGTHVRHAGEIGIFKIVSEESVAAGMRRIEAVTAQGVLELVRRQEEWLAGGSRLLRCAPPELAGRLEGLLARNRDLEREVAQQAMVIARSQVERIAASAEEVGGHRLAKATVAVKTVDELRGVADLVRDRLGSGAVVAGAAIDGKYNMLVALTADLVEKGLKAGVLVKQVAARHGGSGGGRPELAQAGFRREDDLRSAMAEAGDWLAGQLS